MAHIRLTHPSGPIGDKLYNVGAVHGSVPADVITVVFTKVDNLTDAEWTGATAPYPVGAAGSFVNPVWKLFGPDGPPRVLSDDVNPDGTHANPKEFIAVTPGRYLVRLEATKLVLVAGAVTEESDITEFSAFVEIEDPNVLGNLDGGHLEYAPGSIGTSFMAPTERNEFDPDEGWSRSAERYFSTVSKQLGNRRILSGRAAGAIAYGDLVTFTSYEQWKDAIVGVDPAGTEVYYYNYVVEFRKVELGDINGGDILELPLFVALQSAGALERTYALIEGTIPYDTINNLGAAAASLGDRIYASIGGSITTEKPSDTDAGYLNRCLGEVTGTGLSNVTNPGYVFFHGTIPWLPDVVSGPLESTDDALVRWDGVTGQKIKDSKVLLTQAEGPPVATITPSDTPRTLKITTPQNQAGDTSSIHVLGGPGVAAGAAGSLMLQGGAGAAGDGGDVEIDGGPSVTGTDGAVGIQTGSPGLTTVSYSGVSHDFPLQVWHGLLVTATSNHAKLAVMATFANNDAVVGVHSEAESWVEIKSANDSDACDVRFGDTTTLHSGTISYKNSVNHAGDYFALKVWDFTAAAMAEILRLTSSSAHINGDLAVSGDAVIDQEAAIGGALIAGKALAVTGNAIISGDLDVGADLDVVGKLTVGGLIDPTGLVLNEQDPAAPPYDPTGGSADTGLIYVAEDAGADPNTLRWIDNQGNEVIISESEISSPDDVGGVISTDKAIASWNGVLGDNLRNTRVLIDAIGTGPSISTDGANPIVVGGVLVSTPFLTIATADGQDPGGGLSVPSGALLIKTGAPFTPLFNDLAFGGSIEIHAADGSGEDYNSANAGDGKGGSTVIHSGATSHMHAAGGASYLMAGSHRGGLIRDGATGDIDPGTVANGIGAGGEAGINAGSGNTGGDINLRAGHSLNLDAGAQPPGIGQGGAINLLAGMGGLWETSDDPLDADYDEPTEIHGSGVYGGTVRIIAGDSAASVDNGGNPFLRHGGSGGQVEILAGDAGESTGKSLNNGGVPHGTGGGITLRAGMGDHLGNAGDIYISTQHARPTDPNDNSGVLQGIGQAGDITIKASDTVGPNIMHRKMGGSIAIEAGKAKAGSESFNLANNGTNNPANFTGEAKGNVSIKPGEPDFNPAAGATGADADWPVQGAGGANPGELLQPWPSVISLDPDQRGVTVIGEDHFNGLSDNPADPANAANGSMMCNGRVPRLVVEGDVKVRGTVDPTAVSFAPATEHPMITQLNDSGNQGLVADYQALHDSTIWVHENYNNQGPTLMLGSSPIQGGGGGGGGGGNHVGGNVKHLLTWTTNQDISVPAMGGNPQPRDTGVSITVTPTADDSKILLRWNSAFYRDSGSFASGDSVGLFFVRQDLDTSLHRLVPSIGTGVTDPSADYNLLMEFSDVGITTMGSMAWLDAPATTDAIVYRIYAMGDDADSHLGRGGIVSAFEAFEILDPADAALVPEWDDNGQPVVEPNGVGYNFEGSLKLRNDSTMTVVWGGTGSGRHDEGVGVAFTGAMFTNVTTVNSSNIQSSDTYDTNSNYEYQYIATNTDYIISIDSDAIGFSPSSPETIVIDLPFVTAGAIGRTLIIKEAKPDAGITYNILIRNYGGTDGDGNVISGGDVEGQTIFTLNSVPRASVTIYSDGDDYYVV
jgi:hypothetical protein